LDLKELLGVSQAFGADEDVAFMIVRSTSPPSLTDSAGDSRTRHGSIFAFSSANPAIGHSASRSDVLGWRTKFRSATAPYRAADPAIRDG
jgi:hypothetical protein